MYDKSTNEITFPHIIPGGKLGGKDHTWNDVDGGAVRVADLLIDPNKFYGGQVLVLGWIKEYGMYACQSKDTGDIVGFYVHEPDKLTKTGKKLVKEAFPSRTVKFEYYKGKHPTPEDIQKLHELREYYKANGVSPVLVERANAEELESLWKAIQSGKAEKPLASQEPVKQGPASNERAKLEHDGSTVSEKILKNKPKPQKRYVK